MDVPGDVSMFQRGHGRHGGMSMFQCGRGDVSMFQGERGGHGGVNMFQRVTWWRE